MKVTVTYNDKSVQVNLTDAQLETLGLKEKKKPTGYERVGDLETYYYTEWSGEVSDDYEKGSSSDHVAYSSGNYVSDENLARANARADSLMWKLRRFAAENGGIPSVEDWKNSFILKYYIQAFYEDDHGVRPECTWLRGSRDAFQIYFKSKEDCEKAIEEFKDELTWYFTEYQAMLY